MIFYVLNKNTELKNIPQKELYPQTYTPGPWAERKLSNWSDKTLLDLPFAHWQQAVSYPQSSTFDKFKELEELQSLWSLP